MYALVQSFGNTTSDCAGGLTPAQDFTTGNLLTLWVATDYAVAGTPPTITPSAVGLAFVAGTPLLSQFTTNDFFQLFLVKNLTGGSAPNIAVVCTGASQSGYGIQATCAEWSGVSATAPLVQYASAASTNYFGPTTTTLSGITVGNLLVFFQMNLDGGLTTATVTSGTTSVGFTTPFASGRSWDGQWQTAGATSQSATNVAAGGVYAAPGMVIVEYLAGAAAPSGSVIFDSMNFRSEPRIVRPSLNDIRSFGRPRRRRSE